MNKLKIAIVGIACRFPGAQNYQEFWNNLAHGVNSIQKIPPERWDIDQYYSSNIDESRACHQLSHMTAAAR